MPPDAFQQAVHVLEELPGQARLPDARRPDHGHEPAPPFAPRRVEQLLQEAQLVLPPDEGRLQRLRPVPAAALGHDPDGLPGGNRRRLPLERLLAGRLEGDRLARGTLGRLAHEHGPRAGNGLEPRRGVHQVARDHSLAHRPERHRGLAGQHSGPGAQGWAQPVDGLHELERRPDGQLGIVLARDRRSPDRHHRVADELLDRAAVALDDLAAQVEVARQQLPRVLGVTALGQGRESDEVGEEDRNQAALGNGRHARRRRARRRGRPRGERPGRAGRRGAALATELVVGKERATAGGARLTQPCPAFLAELRAGRILRAAARAVHPSPPRLVRARAYRTGPIGGRRSCRPSQQRPREAMR